MAGRLAQQQVEAIIQGKLAASYWLGLIEIRAKERIRFRGDAITSLVSARCSWAFGPRVFWAAGAHYNIARTLEAERTAAKGDRPVRVQHPFTKRFGNLFLRNDRRTSFGPLAEGVGRRKRRNRKRRSRRKENRGKKNGEKQIEAGSRDERKARV